MKTVLELVAGDYVAVSGSHSVYAYGIVERVTPTLVVLQGSAERYYREDGRQVGYNRVSIRPSTAEEYSAWQAERQRQTDARIKQEQERITFEATPEYKMASAILWRVENERADVVKLGLERLREAARLLGIPE